MDEIQQRWLCALSAPMAAINTGASYDDPAFCDDHYIDLKDSWGIDDRGQLFDMLERMTDDGHAKHLSAAYLAWQRCLPSEWQALLDDLSPRERILHEFASRTFGSCGPGDSVLGLWAHGLSLALCGAQSVGRPGRKQLAAQSFSPQSAISLR